jgi:methionyl-tRNA formyltransferase
MRIAIIGRTEVLYDVAVYLRQAGFNIVGILTAKEAPEYTRTADDFRALAADWGIPFGYGARILEHAIFLKDVAADIGVSINYSGVIPAEIIGLFPLGVLNAHGGDLPRYRGNACQAWAILNGETRVGLCVHRMVGGELDSGDIVAREYLDIDYTTKVTDIWRWIAEKTPMLMLSAVRQLSENAEFALERQSADPRDALYCYPRRPEDGRIDWGRSAIDILRLVNASNRPYAGAYCDFDGDKLVIWDAELVIDEQRYCAVPGQVVKIGDCYAEIACGSGKLKILRVEYRGRECTGAALFRSVRSRLT